MVHHVRDLSSIQRSAIENLLGRALLDEESLTIRPARVLQDAPPAQEQVQVFRQYQGQLDAMAERAREVPEAEMEAALEEALYAVRHPAE